jgi:hypothetical protein
LLEQHIAKTNVWFVDAYGEHKLLNVMIHGDLARAGRINSNRARAMLFLIAIGARSFAKKDLDQPNAINASASPTANVHFVT